MAIDAAKANAETAAKRKLLGALEDQILEAGPAAVSGHNPLTARPPPRTPGNATEAKTGSAHINPNRLYQRDRARMEYQVQLTEEERVEDTWDPAFFGQCAPRLEQGWSIRVVAFGMKRVCDLLVYRSEPSLFSVWCVVDRDRDFTQQIADRAKF